MVIQKNIYVKIVKQNYYKISIEFEKKNFNILEAKLRLVV